MLKKYSLILAAVVAAVPASATVLIDVSDPTVTMLGPSNYLWEYDVYLTPGSRLRSPGATPCNTVIQGGICDGLLTIYDFYGYIPGTVATTAVGWTQGTAQNTGTTPAGLAPSDDPLGLNLTWLYTGTAQIDASVLAAPVFLGTFSARSLYSVPHLEDYASRTSSLNNQRSANIESTYTPTAVPEPGSLALVGAGLMLLGLKVRRRP